MANKSTETLIKEKINAYIKQGVISGRKSVAKNIAYDFDKDLYYVTLNYGTVNGKRKKPNETFKTAKEAVNALLDFEADKQRQDLIVPDKKTVGQYCDIWLEDYCKQTPSTKKFYKNIINVHIKSSFLARMKLQEVTTADINRFLTQQCKRTDKKLSSSTIKHHRTALLTIFRHAEEDELIRRNPVQKSRQIEATKKPTEAYTREEIQRIIELSKDEPEPYCYIYPLAIYTGMSRGELCGLKWSRVDLSRNMLLVAETRTDETHGMETKEVKSKSRIRPLELIEDAKNMLNTIKSCQQKNKNDFGTGYLDSDFVFVYADGSVPYPRTISKNFQWFLEKHRIRVLPFHDLRHTFGTFQRITGASSYDIKEMMGHSSITVAETNYIKGFAKDLRPQMQKFQEYLNGTPEKTD